jgi:hypothetical protein
MTTFLLGALVTFCAALSVEGYFILGNQQRMRTANEQILDANMRLLALHPSKSAARTEAAVDAPAYVPYAALRAQEFAAVEPEPDAPELDQWADDGGTAPPVLAPETRPAAVVLVEHWAADVDTTDTGPIEPVLDDVDRLLMARFNLTEGRTE